MIPTNGHHKGTFFGEPTFFQMKKNVSGSEKKVRVIDLWKYVKKKVEADRFETSKMYTEMLISKGETRIFVVRNLEIFSGASPPNPLKRRHKIRSEYWKFRPAADFEKKCLMAYGIHCSLPLP